MKYKFRVWDNVNRCFWYSEEIGMQEFWRIAEFHAHVDQWTGLTDKNDQDIYSGDIVSNDIDGQEYCSPAVVSMSVYEEVGWALYFIPENAETQSHFKPLKKVIMGVTLYEEFLMIHFFNRNYEVIGNVYQDFGLITKQLN